MDGRYMDLIRAELSGLYGEEVLRDMAQVIRLYALYDGDGQRWPARVGELDYEPTVKRTNFIKKIIKEESRFMMGKEPEIRIAARYGAQREGAAAIERWLGEVLGRARWGDKLIKGARDCFIGKRVALKLTGAPGGELGVQFRPSPEFVYEVEDEDSERLAKVIFFYQIRESMDRSKQRIWRQKYEMRGGRCLLSEAVCDGFGNVVEMRCDGEDTGLDFIPVYVIVNDGLTGDMLGESDVAELWDDQDAYNRLKSDDMDALRFNLFPMRVFKDASQETMDNIKIAPGALVDASTEPASGQQVSAEILESKFSYDDRMEHALERIKEDMHALMNVPNLSVEKLKGYAASGKAMKSLYWGLMCRCEEKWNAWDAALVFMADAMVKMARAYGIADLPDVAYTVHIEHRYPIPDDEEAEREGDMREVAQGVRSRRGYIEKWQPEIDGEAELEQIAKERGAGE